VTSGVTEHNVVEQASPPKYHDVTTGSPPAAGVTQRRYHVAPATGVHL
jgi:hypothetical protein